MIFRLIKTYDGQLGTVSRTLFLCNSLDISSFSLSCSCLAQCMIFLSNSLSAWPLLSRWTKLWYSPVRIRNILVSVLDPQTSKNKSKSSSCSGICWNILHGNTWVSNNVGHLYIVKLFKIFTLLSFICTCIVNKVFLELNLVNKVFLELNQTITSKDV